MTRYGRVLYIGAFLVLLVVGGWLWRQERQVQLLLGARAFMLDRADTAAQQEQGLSGRDSMARDAGMVFVFDQPGVQCFWMKDMHFPLDMLWLNASRQVVHVERDVAPGTYPKTFCPSVMAMYVIELNAGQTASAGIRPGDNLVFLGL